MFDRVIENVEFYGKGVFDIGGCAFNSEDKTISVFVRDAELVGFGEIFYDVVVFFRRAEFLGELFRSQELAVVWTVWILKTFDEGIEFVFVAKRQTDCKLQFFFRTETTQRMQPGNSGGNRLAQQDLVSRDDIAREQH